jgi:hypothetical protein
MHLIFDGVGDVGLLLRVLVEVVRARNAADLMVEIALHPKRIAVTTR